VRKTILFAVLLLVAGVVSAPLWAQGLLGAISGTVLDQTKQVVPGATVTLTNQDTGNVITQITTDVGTFSFARLPLDRYTLSVELTGFKKAVRQNIETRANQVTNVTMTLEVGGVSEVVTVESGGELVNTTSPQLEGYTTKSVADIPIPDLTGNPINLAVLAPGTTSQPGGVVGEGGAIGGNRPRNNNFVVDGLDNNDPSITGSLTPVIQDSVEEFTLLTNQFSAEYGHSTGGQFITTTRSGTNSIHGRGWWYSQNRHLNSLDNITRSTTAPGSVKPRYDYNRFGGDIGGPIMKDKWFYFGAFEYRDQTLGAAPSGQIFVPTSAGLSALESLAADSSSGVSSVMVDLLKNHAPLASTGVTSFPVINQATGASTPIEFGNFSGTTPNFDRTHLFSVSSDYQTNTHRINGRFAYSRERGIQPGNLPTAEFNNSAIFDTRRLTVGDVWSYTPEIVNEARVGYTRSVQDLPLTLPQAPGSTDVFGNYSINDLSLDIGPNGDLPQSTGNNIYEAADTFTWIRGAHNFKFGAQFHDYISPSHFLPRSRGEYTWTSLDSFVHDAFPDAVSIRGVGTDVFAVDRMSWAGFAQDNWKIHPRVTAELGLRYEFAQPVRDQKLQNLNAIADVTSIQDEVYTQQLVDANGLDPSLVGQNIFNTLPPEHQAALLSHVGNSVIFKAPKADKNNWAPRVGLSWDVFGDGRTSVRAGAGIAYDVLYGNLALLQLPPQFQAENRETNACLLSPSPSWCSLVPAGTSPLNAPIRHSTIGFIEGGALLPVLPTDAFTNQATARAATQAYVMNEVAPETYTWTLSLQHEMATNYMVEARYVGTKAIHMPLQRWLSAGVPNPVQLPLFGTESEALAADMTAAPTLADFEANQNLLLAPYGFGGVLTEFTPDANSWYHGGSIRVERRFANNLTFQGSYTFSKTIDIIENDLFTSFVNPRRPFNHLNPLQSKGLSGLDRTHKFALGWLYQLPALRNMNPILGDILGGWQVNGTYLAESGQPVTVISRRDINGDFDTAGDTAFLNPSGAAMVGTDVNFVCRGGSGTFIAGSADGCVPAGSTMDPSNFVVGYVAQDPNARYIRGELGATPTGNLGLLGRDTARGPGINNWNLAFFKEVRVGAEDRKVQVRAELWNAFNHPSYSFGSGSALNYQSFSTPNPATSITGYVTPGSPQFLNQTALSGGLGQAPFQRVIQLGVKFIF
jgi:hypothetical protein